MTELRHLQKVILGIMKDIDDLCRLHNIDYYLLGGSAIGAIRHKGFIPWDDDLDIIMNNENYNRFMKVCRSELDSSKYYLQEGLKDWSMYFSKIRLKGTKFDEGVSYSNDPDKQGIFIDIFKMDNVSSSTVRAFWQFICAKVYLCYQLASRGDYQKSFSLKKRVLMFMSFPLKIKTVRDWFRSQVEKFNNSETEYYGFFYGRTNLKTAIVKKAIFGNPIRVPFEDTYLCVAEHYHEYLSQMFGDYMTPPPADERVGLHLINVDFGKY